MGTYHAPSYPDLDRLEFRRFPSRPQGIGRIVRVGSLVAATAANSDRVVYCNHGRTGNHCMILSPCAFRQDRDLFRALVKLGKLSQATYDKLAEREKTVRERQDAEYVLKSAVGKMEELGVKLTKHQRRKLDAFAAQPGKIF